MNFKRAWDLFHKYENDRFFDEVFKAEIYKPVRELKHPKTIIDIGALHGEFSLYVYDVADKIYAIEPLPEAYEKLVENCKDLEKISTHQMAIGNVNEPVKLYGGDDGGAFTSEGLEEGGHTLVPCTTLANFMEDNKIEHVDALKIDIEGGEGRVFHSSDFASVAPKIDFIIGEHGAGIADFLRPLGFEFKDGWTARRIK